MSPSQSSRIAGLLIQLQNKSGISIASLSATWNVPEDIVLDDIGRLQRLGLPIAFYEDDVAALNKVTLKPVFFTDEELELIINKLEIQKENSLEYLPILEKLDAGQKLELPNKKIQQSKIIGRIKISDKITMLERAIGNKNVAHIVYQTGYKDEVNERHIEAQAIYHTHQHWIVIAWCRLRNDFREFRLDRIVDLKLKSEEFESRDFNLMRYFYEILSP